MNLQNCIRKFFTKKCICKNFSKQNVLKTITRLRFSVLRARTLCCGLRGIPESSDPTLVLGCNIGIGGFNENLVTFCGTKLPGI